MSSLVLWLISLIRDFCQLGWRTCCDGDTLVLEEELLERRVQQGPQQSQHLLQLQSLQPVQPVVQNMATNTMREPPSYAGIEEDRKLNDFYREPDHKELRHRDASPQGLWPTGTPAHRNSGPQGLRPTGTPAHRDSGPQELWPTRTLAHRDSGPQGLRPTGTPVHRDSPQGSRPRRGTIGPSSTAAGARPQ